MATGTTAGGFTSNQVGGMFAISAITSAFTAYEAGKMREIAYNHEAAMAEINAKQIGIDAQFIMADKMDELRSTLALQNVIAAATGRAGGSIENLAQTSVGNLKREEERIRLTGKAKSVATMMDAASSRAAGKSAAAMGLLSGVGELTGGAAQAARFIS